MGGGHRTTHALLHLRSHTLTRRHREHLRRKEASKQVQTTIVVHGERMSVDNLRSGQFTFSMETCKACLHDGIALNKLEGALGALLHRERSANPDSKGGLMHSSDMPRYLYPTLIDDERILQKAEVKKVRGVERWLCRKDCVPQNWVKCLYDCYSPRRPFRDL